LAKCMVRGADYMYQCTFGNSPRFNSVYNIEERAGKRGKRGLELTPHIHTSPPMKVASRRIFAKNDFAFVSYCSSVVQSQHPARGI